jgi:tetratricopeptide (TPR) repeat protein
MSIINKLFGASSKQAAKLKQADKLLGQSKLAEAQALLATMWSERAEETPAEELAELTRLRLELCRRLLGGDAPTDSLVLASELTHEGADKQCDLAALVVERGLLEPAALTLVRHAIDHGPSDKKRLLLTQAKLLLDRKADSLSAAEFEFVTEAAKAFPLWKEGVGLLADRMLRDNRRDAEALAIYRNAYPHRKADVRLREVLLESLIVNHEKDEFSASVYKDAVETGDNPQALHLLAEYYITKREFNPATLPYIERALDKSKLHEEELKLLSEQVLASSSEFVDKAKLLLRIFQQGYSDRELLTVLSNALAEQSKFDDEAIDVMTRAFEARVVTKRAILILTEHCLANEREDDFALRVYESYMSTWPDRPQRRIYAILAHHYAGLTRVDDQAQKIYEEALEDNPTDSDVIRMLARAYHSQDKRDEKAEQSYRHAFTLSDGEVKQQLAVILSEMKVEAGVYNEETLKYLTTMGRPKSGSLKDRYDEALTSCFLTTGRRGEQAREAYFGLFVQTENSDKLNPKLVELLAELILEAGGPPAPDSIEMRVYRKLFEQQKFSTPPEIAFTLLTKALASPGDPGLNLIHLAVRCFEADATRLIEAVAGRSHEHVLREIGDFYIEHYNFPQAAAAYEASFKLQPTDDVRYRLAKIHLLEGRADLALEHLAQLGGPEYVKLRNYWRAAACQLLGDYEEAGRLLTALEPDGIPAFLLELRLAINSELAGEVEASLQAYQRLLAQPGYDQFKRWLQLQIGIAQMKLGRWEAALNHLEDNHRLSPNGRAEQMFYSLALFFLAHEHLQAGNLDAALPMMTRAVEVNRNDRLLRQVIVDVLCLYGEHAFFDNKLERAARILEVCHRVLPKRVETKVFLAYTYHRMNDYAKALIYYRDITWSDDNPRLERSQAYAYISNNQLPKAWRVFHDLAKRGNLSRENFPRAVACFLSDADAHGAKTWLNIEFPADCDELLLNALLIHDGQYERAVELLDTGVKRAPADVRYRWFLGQAYAHLDKRELAVHHWKELLKLVDQSAESPAIKIRQFTEVGLAFLESGYAKEAMQTWEELRQEDEANPDLRVLYAATLNLNAYQMARKDQHKLASEEWAKALKYDPENPEIIQNYAISQLALDKNDEATRQFHALSKTWQKQLAGDPRKNAHLPRLISYLERAVNTLQLTKGRSDFDLTKVRAEDMILFYKRANQFYWILSLDKRANQPQIEREYFRLIKIFNPERHADDFMLVEESYTNLFKSPQRRELIDIFVLNPVEITNVRARLTRLPRGAKVSFEQFDLPATVPGPDFQQLVPSELNEHELVLPLMDKLAINLKVADWTVL